MKRIKFTHKKLKSVWGLAFPEENRIVLHAGMDERTALEIAIHEALHVLFPVLPEAIVEDAGRRLADLLWRLGFRRD
jgi:hypothetical protein